MVMPPLAGHINPALAVAGQLQARGHDVAWALHGVLAANRLPADARVFSLPADVNLDLSENSREVRGLESVRFFYEDFCLPLARGSLAPLEKIARDYQPDLIFCDHQMLAGAYVARKLGIPWLTSVTTTASILKMSSLLDDWMAQKFSELNASYPLPELIARPDFSPYGVIVFSSPQLVGDKFERVAANYHFVGPAYGQRVDCDNFPWHRLDANKRKILISLGTVSRDRTTRFYEVMMAALADLDIQVVMVAPEALVPQAPKNFIVQSRVPQLQLLPYMDAVICHAGHNTVCETLAQGLPLIVAPIRDDQPVVARQVVDAGAGLFMRFGKVTAATARATVEQLLSDSELKRNAMLLAESFSTLGGAERAAMIIERQLHFQLQLHNQRNQEVGNRGNQHVLC